MADKNLKRIRRQFDAIGRFAPPSRRIINPLLRRKGMRWVRLPFGFVLMLGGIFSFLPVLGIWMLPLGIMLLAVDIPLIRPAVATTTIRGRRRFTRLSRFFRRSRGAGGAINGLEPGPGEREGGLRFLETT